MLLPMARRTIVLGINQTIMAALAMVTIAALIAAPGLGQTVLQALISLDVGTAANAGLAIVIMAIILDRTTTAASVRADDAPAGGRAQQVPPAGDRGGGRHHRGRDLAVLHLPARGPVPARCSSVSAQRLESARRSATPPTR